jgi:hypothetical protein
MTHLWTELAVVEQRALRRGPRMNGLGGTRAALANELDAALNEARTRAYNPPDPTAVISGYGTVQNLFEQYLRGDRSAQVDPSEETVAHHAIEALNPPWLWRHDLAGEGFLSNAAVLGLGAGALALVAGGVYFWRKRR